MRELSSKLQLREDMAVYGDEGPSEVNPAWHSLRGDGDCLFFQEQPGAAAALAVVAVSSLIGWGFLGTDRSRGF